MKMCFVATVNTKSVRKSMPFQFGCGHTTDLYESVAGHAKTGAAPVCLIGRAEILRP